MILVFDTPLSREPAVGQVWRYLDTGFEANWKIVAFYKNGSTPMARLENEQGDEGGNEVSRMKNNSTVWKRIS